MIAASECGLQKEIDRYYSIEADVCNFALAEQGIVAALRPGDMLLLNPMNRHCLSSRISAYQHDDVFFYCCNLKTAVVGGNDNSLT